MDMPIQTPNPNLLISLGSPLPQLPVSEVDTVLEACRIVSTSRSLRLKQLAHMYLPSLQRTIAVSTLRYSYRFTVLFF